jgi:hypothetical protein
LIACWSAVVVVVAKTVLLLTTLAAVALVVLRFQPFTLPLQLTQLTLGQPAQKPHKD